MSAPRQEVLEDEWLIVRHSGEIPEIALHSAFYYLTEDPDGPRLQLSVEERESLQDAAVARYQEVIMRDLCYENRELTIYRGMRRAIFNWRRFIAFCERQERAHHTLTRPGMARRSLQGLIMSDRSATAEAFLHLLQKTLQPGGKTSTDVNHSSSLLGASDTGPSLACGRSSSVLGESDTGPSLACVFNCSFHELTLFARELGITAEQLPQDIHRFYHEQKKYKINMISTR